jgi:hypothetical protein
MGIFGALFLVAASIVGLLAAPALFLYLYHAFPDTWWTELTKIQALSGASVALFAASSGTIGVLLTNWNQRRNLDKQLFTQRQEQDRSRIIGRQQVASAFIGEIGNIVAILGDPAQWQRLSLAIDNLRKDAEDVILPLRPIVTERYYGSNPGNVGLFPNPLPEKLTEFYSRLETLRVNPDRYLEYMPKGELSASDAIRMLEYIGSNTDACVNGGRALTTQLEAIRDAKVN